VLSCVGGDKNVGEGGDSKWEGSLVGFLNPEVGGWEHGCGNSIPRVQSLNLLVYVVFVVS